MGKDISVIDSLASSLGEKGSAANIVLAKRIADSEDSRAVAELVQLLNSKEKRIQSDCIKTLYETGYLKPELIAEYCSDFMNLLSSRNNRMVWGAMVALASIAELKHTEIFSEIELIGDTVKKGSVITIDCGVEIFAKLNQYKPYRKAVEPMLWSILQNCPIKQFPQYIEKSAIAVNSENQEDFLELIDNRVSECEKESQKKRLLKVLKSLNA